MFETKASQDSVSLTLNQISTLILNFQLQNLQPKGVPKRNMSHQLQMPCL